MDRRKILDSYLVDDRGIIRSPGKFQLEKLYVPYFWNRFLDGRTIEVRTNDRICFPVTDEERAQFPELGRRPSVTLVENDDGYVCEL